MSRPLYLILILAAVVAGCAAGGTSPGAKSDAKPAQPAAMDAAVAQKAPPPVAKDKLEDSPLVWKPTKSVARVVDLTGLSQLKLQLAPFTDSRADIALIGQNWERSPARKMTTRDDVAAFVRQNMANVIASAGVPVVSSGGTRILNADLTQFHVDETGKYKGEVRMAVKLTDAEGKTIWIGTTGGTATNFGRSYKAENYYETLSNALVEATYALLRNPAFHDALAK